MGHRFKRMRLKNHLPDGAEAFKIRAIGPQPINPNIADKQHPLLTFTFRFRSEQPCHQVDISTCCSHNRHHVTSPFSPFIILQYPKSDDGGTGEVLKFILGIATEAKYQCDKNRAGER
jgi:hypothetical protein